VSEPETDLDAFSGLGAGLAEHEAVLISMNGF